MDKMREEFEVAFAAEMQQDVAWVSDLWVEEYGCYSKMAECQVAWNMWQAARSAPAGSGEAVGETQAFMEEYLYDLANGNTREKFVTHLRHYISKQQPAPAGEAVAGGVADRAKGADKGNDRGRSAASCPVGG